MNQQVWHIRSVPMYLQVFDLCTASVDSYSEIDNGLTSSGSGLSMQEMNQVLARGSRHAVKHPRR